MPEPHWTSYVGMFSGIAGAVMGFISYRRSNKLKSLDLRLELRKRVNELHQNFKQANEQIIYADKSRKAVASASGFLNSGRMKLWEQDITKDTDLLNKLKDESPSKTETFASLKEEQLESKLVEIYSKLCEVKLF